ncbi:hyaluronidase-like [Scyliorhinus canicula]|uniref:hyaluronidase-like n=1 Tax=Scyliorhinus canicula TaxID=7830 RepID=UPI0018F6A28C|nr:hyaluronidase-like [Scyliorhinus canicula]
MLPGLTLPACTLFYFSIQPAIVWGVDVNTLASPMIYNKPFSVIWNTPIANCKTKFDVALDLGAFDVVENENGQLMGKKITIFYKEQLGLYPYYTKKGIPVNGGLVQNASLSKHLKVSETDIDKVMDQDFSGLAVVDWEDWRPLWDRNWGVMDIYRKKSVELEKSKNTHSLESEIQPIAKAEYETAAQNYMRQTLERGYELRQKGYWGFYKFPDCYNYFKKDQSAPYTGKCARLDVPRNNQLEWLWKVSQCLYPSVYIPKRAADNDNVQKFTHYRVKEALRVAAHDRSIEALPVLIYARYSYRRTAGFLSKKDLVHTIGESAAMGASGMILWGNSNYSRTMDTCTNLKNYIHDHLGPYILNVTRAAMLCSKAVCNGNGRCVRKDPESKAYLHLDPKFSNVISELLSTNPERLRQEIDSEALNSMQEQFKCQCYKSGMGPNCETESNF